MFTALAIFAGLAALASIAGTWVSAVSEKKQTEKTYANEVTQANAAEATAERQTAEGRVSLANEKTSAKVQADQQSEQNMQQSYLQQVANENEYMNLMEQGDSAQGALAARTGASGIQQGTTLQHVQDAQIRDTLEAKKTANNAFRDSSISQVLGTQQQFAAGSAYSNLYTQKADALVAGMNDTVSKIETQKSYLKDQYDDYEKNWWIAPTLSTVGSVAGFASSGIQNKWWAK